MTGPTLTAALCTLRRPGPLLRALRSLAEQSDRPDEILVVDNAPDPAPLARFLEVAFPGARLLWEPVPGLDAARNRALREAGSEVVAFLDDDAVAEPGWAGGLRQAFRDPAVGLATGRVLPLALDTDGQRMFESNGGFSRGDVPRRLPRDAAGLLAGHRAPMIAWAVSIGAGCSLAVRRDLARALGGFDEGLDAGPALPGGGDHDMIWRVLQSGAEVVYRPDAVAAHEHRAEVAAAAAQIAGHQKALVALLTKILREGPGRRAPVAAFLAWRLVKPGVRLARRAAGRDPLPAPVLLRMWGQCWRGLGAYPATRRRERAP